MNFPSLGPIAARSPVPLVACFSLCVATAIACKVPVFRYALERWPVDRYRLVAIIDGHQDNAVDEALERFKAIDQAGVNIETDVIDLSQLSDEELWQLEDFDGSADPPRLQVFYPPKDGQRIKCWEGDLNTESIDRWLNSPLRTQIANDIATGDSAVFLLVEGTDEVRSQQLAQRLQRALNAAEEEIKIPDGVIARGQANQYLRQHPEATMDDVLRSDVPLKVNFRLRRLARDDPDESALLAIVNGLVEQTDEPILVPIFGRGRMLDAIPGADCRDEVILNACRYLVGECSCTVKALNPGVDLMLSVNWSELLGQSVVMVDPQPSSESTSGAPTLVTIPGGTESRADSPANLIDGRLPRGWSIVVLPLALAMILLLLVRLRNIGNGGGQAL